MHSPAAALLSIFFSYLIGSIPFGLIFAKFSGLGDIRKIGSGNIGATNVLRTGSKKIAILTLLADTLKGTLVALLVKFWQPDTIYVASLAALLGHIFPVWLGFKGGKGVATAFGILLGLAPAVALLSFVVWLLTAFCFRYSSLASLVSVGASPLIALVIDEVSLAVFLVFVSCLIIFTHRTNIQRLITKQEPKIGKRKST